MLSVSLNKTFPFLSITLRFNNVDTLSALGSVNVCFVLQVVVMGIVVVVVEGQREGGGGYRVGGILTAKMLESSGNKAGLDTEDREEGIKVGMHIRVGEDIREVGVVVVIREEVVAVIREVGVEATKVEGDIKEVVDTRVEEGEGVIKVGVDIREEEEEEGVIKVGVDIREVVIKTGEGGGDEEVGEVEVAGVEGKEGDIS